MLLLWLLLPVTNAIIDCHNACDLCQMGTDPSTMLATCAKCRECNREKKYRRDVEDMEYPDKLDVEVIEPRMSERQRKELKRVEVNELRRIMKEYGLRTEDLAEECLPLETECLYGNGTNDDNDKIKPKQKCQQARIVARYPQTTTKKTIKLTSSNKSSDDKRELLLKLLKRFYEEELDCSTPITCSDEGGKENKNGIDVLASVSTRKTTHADTYEDTKEPMAMTPYPLAFPMPVPMPFLAPIPFLPLAPYPCSMDNITKEVQEMKGKADKVSSTTTEKKYVKLYMGIPKDKELRRGFDWGEKLDHINKVARDKQKHKDLLKLILNK